MKKETEIKISLLLLSPALGELLSGSAPPLVFFNPVVLFIFLILYGCGTLLIRETRVRWNLQWSVVFLAVAYGIVEEGLLVKSFFNPGWEDMGALSGYGMFLGVQWVWTIMLIIYHATISTLIPIAIIDLLWWEYRDVPLLGKKGMILASSGLVFVTMIGMVFMGSRGSGPFHPDPLLLIGSFSAVLSLTWLAYKFKDSRISTNKFSIFSPSIFGAAGFAFQSLNFFMPNILASIHAPASAALSFQFIELTFASCFAAYQIYHKDITERHIVSLISGSVIFFILLTPVQEFNRGLNPDPTQGMLAVGIAGLVLLLMWRNRILKNNII